MSKKVSLALINSVESKIFLIRDQRVMIDADLAELYGVATKALNQSVKRNIRRFPPDFFFRLTPKEKKELVTNCDRFNRLKHSTSLPYAFTEHGAVMLATVLNSARAIQTSLYVVRAFIKLRSLLSSHRDLSQKILELEKKFQKHDYHINELFEAIRQLLLPAVSPSKKIGFKYKQFVKKETRYVERSLRTR